MKSDEKEFQITAENMWLVRVGPDWHFWSQMALIEIWKAAYLSCNADPEGVIYFGSPEGVKNKTISNRMRQIVAHYLKFGGIVPHPDTKNEYWGRVDLAEFARWAISMNWDIPESLRSIGGRAKNEQEDSHTGAHENFETQRSSLNTEPTVSLSRNEVMMFFPVMVDAEQNEKFWNDKLSRVPRWLESARMQVGKPGVSSRWDPLLIAHSVLNRKSSPRMTIRQLDGVFKQDFPDLLEQWKDETTDFR